MKRVALGMSGGIDSTVCALLLQQSGYEVIGVTMSIWDENSVRGEISGGSCFGPQEKENLVAALMACAKLGIEHHIVPLQREFATCVLDYFRSTYLAGKTPNPCVVCNQSVKLGFLPRRLKQLGIHFDLFATGHYVRNDYSEQTGRWQLRKAKDPGKDQSYFLCYLTQEQLANTIFPLGNLTKSEIRALAAMHGMDFVLTRKESQDFLGSDQYPLLFPDDSFQPGNMVDPEGKIVGTHKGIIHYTVGQRKNLGLSGKAEPWYVISLDVASNQVLVGLKQYLYKDRLTAQRVNWLSIDKPDREIRAEAKIRFGHDAAPCQITPTAGDEAELVFDTPQLSITPGQMVVFYSGDLLLGGGMIK